MEHGGCHGEDFSLAELTAGMPLPVPGEVGIGDRGGRLLAVEGVHGASDGRAALVVDGDRFQGALSVRNWRRGDWFCPVGMGGRRKKLQDFFVDGKVDRKMRARIPLVVAPAGIVWVAGYRGDERFAAGPTTIRPVTLSLAAPVGTEESD